MSAADASGDELVRIILRDPRRPDLWEQTVEVFRGYAEQLISEGRARWERPRPIGFVWPTEDAPAGSVPRY